MGTRTKLAKLSGTSQGIDKGVYWYASMVRMRRFEERASQLYGRQKIRGFCHLYIGQEACAAGSVSALEKGDQYITAYRDHALPLALGTESRHVMAELYGKASGVSRGKGGSMHIFDVKRHFWGGHGIVGGQIPLGAGLAFAEKYQKTGKLCITFMGDGAVRQGAFHEALNLAMTLRLPVIFVIENNGYAMGTSVARSSNVSTLADLGLSYEMPSESINGMRVDEVHEAVTRAAKRARSEFMPTLLEMRTYRYKGHSMSDPAQYRSKNEVEQYRKQDPIEYARQLLLKKKSHTDTELEKIDDTIEKEMDEAVAFAEKAPWPDPKEAVEDVYTQNDYPFAHD